MQQRYFKFALLILLGAVLLAGFAPAASAQTAEPAAGGECAAATPCAPQAAAPTFVGVSFDIEWPALLATVESQPVSSGFGLAWAVMILLIAALLYALVSAVVVALGRSAPALPDAAGILIPILSVIGLGVAIYMTFVESRNVKAVCGPVGDCNTVQSSPYARLFGFVPVGLLGVIGYVGILIAWAVSRSGRRGAARLEWPVLLAIAPLALFGMALFGVLFTIYLTYLELFVIHAVCIWCLSSAVIMALILIVSVGPAMAAMGEGTEGQEEDA